MHGVVGCVLLALAGQMNPPGRWRHDGTEHIRGVVAVAMSDGSRESHWHMASLDAKSQT